MVHFVCDLDFSGVNSENYFLLYSCVYLFMYT